MNTVIKDVNESLNEYDNVLYGKSNVNVHKLNKGFYRSFLRCDMKTEYSIHAVEYEGNSDLGNDLHVKYHTNACMKLLCPSSYPADIRVYENGALEEVIFARFIRRSERFCFRNIGPCKCCCFQEMVIHNADGSVIGYARESTWCCFPLFYVLNDNCDAEYVLSPPLCCFGICVDPFVFDLYSGCQVPVFIFPPFTYLSRGNEVGVISSVFPGYFSLCCVGERKEKIQFPNDISVESKVKLLGALFLLNNVYFRPCRPILSLLNLFQLECITDLVLSCFVAIITDVNSLFKKRVPKPVDELSDGDYLSVPMEAELDA